MTPEIELVSAFRKSSHSAQMDNCVELARTSFGGHAVRDSKLPSSPVQYHGPSAWTRFLAALRAGEARGV